MNIEQTVGYLVHHSLLSRDEILGKRGTKGSSKNLLILVITLIFLLTLSQR